MKRSIELLPDIETQKKNLLKRLNCLHGADVINYLQQNKTQTSNPCVGQYPLGEEYFIDSNSAYLFMREVNKRKSFGVVVTAKNTSGSETAKLLDFGTLDARIDEYDQSLLKTGKHCDAMTNDFHDVFDFVSRCKTYLDVWNLIKGKRIKVSAVNTVNVARHNAANQVIGIRTFHVPVFTFVNEQKTNDGEHLGIVKNCVIAHENQTINVAEFQNAFANNDEPDLLPIKKYGCWGFANKEGKIVIPCKWKYAFSFSEELAYVEDFDNKHYYLDKKGNVAIISIWSWADAFFEGLARIRNEKMKYGFMDKNGNVIIPCKWTFVHRFNSGLALVQNAFGKTGFIDKHGKEVIPCKWNNASDFVKGLAAVEDDNHAWGYIDNFGHEVISCKYGEANVFSEGLACVCECHTKYDYGTNFTYHVLGKYGFINKSGQVVIPFKWKHANSFKGGLALVENENCRFGYIDITGKEIITCQWLIAGIFNEGLAYVKDSNGKYGYIDINGDIVIPCIWSSAENFNNGYARVRYPNGLLTVIDRSGNICD